MILLLLYFARGKFATQWKFEERSGAEIYGFIHKGAGGSRPTGMLIAPELWHCGSDMTTRNYSYQTAASDCPSLAAALNHCCAVHDDCYGQQSGQEKCDEDFCECNRVS
uniref:Phospholipase A2 n=1 Tax=Caenorhabditis japonica TaxID=281687 RepID=A0A8R1I7B4_CAEJA